MRDVVSLGLQDRQRLDDLCDHACDERRIETPPPRTIEEDRQPLAGNMGGHERQRPVPFQPLHGDDERKRVIGDLADLVDALAQGLFESVDGCQRGIEAEHLQRVGPAVVEHQQPIAETVDGAWRVPTGHAVVCWCRRPRALRMAHNQRSISCRDTPYTGSVRIREPQAFQSTRKRGDAEKSARNNAQAILNCPRYRDTVKLSQT